MASVGGGGVAVHAKGSEWRRWDVHIHTPGTILNDEFGEWEEYLAAIERQQDVKVIGVTDYMSIANYSRLRGHKGKGRIANIDLLLANIEFRIAPPTEKATADDPQHEREILNALGRLDWEFGDRRYSCLPDQLTALGRAFDPKIRADSAALQAGVMQFKVDFGRFREWYDSEPWLRQHSLVAVAAGTDGLSGFRRDGAWAALRDEITRFSHALSTRQRCS
jgi:hypothetical protein